MEHGEEGLSTGPQAERYVQEEAGTQEGSEGQAELPGSGPTDPGSRSSPPPVVPAPSGTHPRRIRLAVGIPAYGSKLDIGHAGMWLSFGHALAVNDSRFDLVLFGEADCNPVADSRNVIIRDALSAGADWVVMVDADTYHRGDDDGGVDMLQMVSDGDKLGAAMIGAAVMARRWNPPRRTVWNVSLVAAPGRQVPMTDDEFRGKVVQCTRLGGAFVAVNLNFIREQDWKPPWFTHEPQLAVQEDERVFSFGEDLGFCDAIRIRGGKIYVDGRFFPKHVMVADRR